ncbi:MAG TPA: hypothetical protein VFN67_24900 [Polyangiales bacterium]|nr:hypothetical protein [Polyangiales bacterium]
MQTWLFGVPFALGILLVVCSALGAAELDDMIDADGEGLAGDQGLLVWLGLGRVPAILVVTFLLLIFGGVGLLLCTPLSAALGTAAGFFATVPVASASAFLGTSLSTRGLASILPQTESYAPNPDELLGRLARVSVCLDAVSCIVRVTDAAGAEHRLQCRRASDDVSGPLAVGDQVLLIGRGARVYVARKVS